MRDKRTSNRIERVMDLSSLKRKLVAVARSNPPRDQVPYAFEKRIMAGLAALPPIDEWVWWGRALWRGAAACAAVALLISAWTFFPLSGRNPSSGTLDLEDTVLASVNEADPTW
jgi:hypothetical protein